MTTGKMDHITEIRLIRNASTYLSRLLNRQEYMDWLWSRNNLFRSFPLTELYRDLRDIAVQCSAHRDIARVFREFKQRHFLRIGGRDLLGLADFFETTRQLTDLAGVTLQVGLEVLQERPELWSGREDPEAMARSLRENPVTVMGLGKLGGGELNYVSDVDLVFLKKTPGGTGGHRRLCQALCRLVGDQLEGDKVFATDLRLRPMGKDGELVPSMEAAAEYYLNSGRAWERQALLKARPVAGDRGLGRAFLQEVAPFVFRRFMDFQALEELRSMRDRILAELKRTERDLFQDVKLGRGGIREIEFIVQSFQLVYGGRYRELDEPNTLSCLDRLRKLGLLPAEVSLQLQQDYVFLRRVEHWLQLDQNRQARRVPEADADRRRLAATMGPGYEVQNFAEELEACGNRVHEHFTTLFGPGDKRQGTGDMDQETGRPGPQMESGSRQTEAGAGLSVSVHSESLEKTLSGFPGPVRRTVASALEEFAGVDRELFFRLLTRVERFVRQVASRPGLVRTLEAGPGWLEQVVRGTLRSGMVASLLAHQPALVEGIASAGEVWQPFAEWSQRGESILAGSHAFDEAMEWIRRLRNERLLMLALAEQEGRLFAEETCGELSDLADFVIRHTYNWVRDHLGLPEDLPLAVMALGKLGSREFGYLSDLDLMFVYEPPGGREQEAIPQKVMRLAQRLMRMLSTPLQEGPGYLVDAELRPSGSYGPLAVTRNSWEEYYAHQADIWEIQALLRLRAVAGDIELGRGLEAKAQSICAASREADSVWPRLCHLRKRMETERSQDGPERLDIKLGYGGLADLEFLVQGGQLLGCGGSVARDRGSVMSLIEPVLRDLGFSGERARTLRRILVTYRSLEHRLQLDSDRSSPLVTPYRLDGLMQLGLWPPQEPEHHDLQTWTDLTRMRQLVRGCWRLFCEEE